MKLDKICLFTLACAMTAACADLNYTEENTRDEEWTYEYFVDGIKNMVFDVYAQVYNQEFGANSTSFLAGATDEAVYAMETGAINNYSNGAWSPANPMSTIWDKSYTAISSIHMYLEKIHKADLSEWEYNANYQNWVAQMEVFPYELRFLRAYFYFELFRAYGDVPLVTTTLTNAEANNVKRAPAADIVKFIVDEIDEIAPHLPLSYMTEPGAEIGRANRVAAYALKARTLLYAASPLHNPTNDPAKWDEAAKAYALIIDNAADWGLKLSKYSDLWGNEAFFNKELIWGIGRGEKNSDNTPIIDFEKAHFPIGVENASSGNCPSQTLVDQYEYQADGKTFKEKNPGSIDLNAVDPYEGLDPRFALTVVKNGDQWPANSAQKKVIETFYGGFNAAPKYGATPTGYYLRKYVDGSAVTTTNNSVGLRHTWIVFRLGHIYLDYAEAVYNATGSANAKTYGLSANEAINVLRNRADIAMPEFTEDGAAWVERYERERFVELAFENHRFWDVRRWKKGDQYFKNVTVANISAEKQLTRSTVTREWDDKYYLYPIPQTEIKKNPALVQNPGW